MLLRMSPNINPRLPNVDPARTYTAREAADLLNVTEGTVKNHCRKGTLVGKRVGPKKQWRIKGCEIIRLWKKWWPDDI